MKGNFFKKSAALLAAGCLCVSTGYLASRAYAESYSLDGKVSSNVYVQADAKELVSTENFFGTYAYNDAVPDDEVYMPGDTITGTANIENKNDSAMHLYLYAQPTDTSKFGTSGFLQNNSDRTTYNQAQLKAASDELVKVIELDVKYTDTEGNTQPVYSGKLNGAKSGDTTMNDSANPIDLGVYRKGDKGTLSFTLNIPSGINGDKVTTGGQTLDVGYNGAVAMVDWIFVAEEHDDGSLPVSPPTPTPTPKSSPSDISKPVPSPSTGEEAIPYAVGAGLCAVSAFAMLFAAFRSKRKAEEE